MNDSRITLAVLACVTLLALAGRIGADAWLALVGGSLLSSPLAAVKARRGRT